MFYPRLLWQIFPSYLLITLVGLVAVGVFASRTHEKFYIRLIREELQRRAELVTAEIGNDLSDAEVQRITPYARRVSATTQTRITVILPDGRVVCDTDEDPTKMQLHDDRQEFAAALRGEIGVREHFSNTLKKWMTYVATPVQRGGRVVGAVRAALPVTTVDEVIGRAKYELVGWGLLIAVLCAAVSWLVSRHIARPLELMREGADRFARGELAYKLPIPASREMAGLTRALNDMAEQTQARIDTIVEQSSRQDAVLESMVEGVLAVDANQKIISLNPAAAELLGCARKAALGRNAQHVIVDAQLRQLVARALGAAEPIEQDLELHAGGDRIIRVRGTGLGGLGEQRRGAVIVLNDITNVRRLENLRRDFVANVSHELKTPITSIKGFVETLLDGAIDDHDDARRFLGIVGKQADRLGAIVEDLLSLAKIEQSEEHAALDLHAAGLRGVLEEAIHNCDALAEERKVAVRLDLDGDITAEINPPLLEQAVTNLLDNAIKYSPSEREVIVSAEERDGQVLISVQDHGCGIEAEHIPRLFERFYRVDKARSRKLGGTGLGLAIVKHIVSAHRGRVEVDSTPGQGSRFTIVLPRSH